ncbi:MAG: TIR protein [Bacteroidetes bacterium]|nr:MAG: TIR protein [Bacteroidota bacterium]
MKKSAITIFLAMILLKTIAQDYMISFTGTGDTTDVSTINIENLTSGVFLTINGGDILHLVDAVGLENSSIDNTALTIYPNPLITESMITFFAPENSNVVLSIVDLSGRVVVQTSKLLLLGRHNYRISGLGAGMYFVNVAGDTYSSSAKLISQSVQKGEACISYISSETHMPDTRLKNTGVVTDMPYTDGDQLIFKGFSGQYSSVYPDIPMSDKTIEFDFVKCQDGDGNSYATVGIGDQIWMAENLKVGTRIDGNQELTNNSIIEKYCFNNLESNCDAFGGLYQWNEAMQYDTTQGVQGICPSGWHIPTDAEWCQMEVFLDAIVNCTTVGWRGTDVGGKMKCTGTLEAGTGLWRNPNSGATNQSGFSAVPGGTRYSFGAFDMINYEGTWWSSTQSYPGTAWIRVLQFMQTNVHRNGYGKNDGYSLRCVSDVAPISLPTVTTSPITEISFTTATSGGNVSSAGGGAITSRGVCWSTSTNPTIANNYTVDGGGIGTFISAITGLTANTTYFLRSYATNNAGTSYGDELSFTTLGEFPYIGQSYQGGIIFYIDGSGQHGLIAATSDQSNGAPYGCYGYSTPGTSTTIGSGQSNTIAILNYCGDTYIAARICNDLILDGYDDWFLPSRDELVEMYIHKVVIGNFSIYDYWTSSEVDPTSGWEVNFDWQGGAHMQYKGNPGYVRAIRAF